MKTVTILSFLLAMASAIDMAAREAQPAAQYASLSEDVKAAILSNRKTIFDREQYNCDGACIEANSAFCSDQPCESGIDINCFICCAIHHNNCPDCSLGGQYC